MLPVYGLSCISQQPRPLRDQTFQISQVVTIQLNHFSIHVGRRKEFKKNNKLLFTTPVVMASVTPDAYEVWSLAIRIWRKAQSYSAEEGAILTVPATLDKCTQVYAVCCELYEVFRVSPDGSRNLANLALAADVFNSVVPLATLSCLHLNHFY